MNDTQVDLLAVLREARASHAKAQGEVMSEYDGSLARIDRAIAAMTALLAAGHRADGNERAGRPERGPGYSDADWDIFLRGWDAHADAVFRSGLRAALADAEPQNERA